MIAIVTDRPNVGREIARVLGADRKENGYMTGNGYMVTWTYGNMLSLAMPKDSGTARVEWKDFPLLPPSFLTVRHVKTDTGWNPDINALLQLKIIAKVLNACDTYPLRQPTLPGKERCCSVIFTAFWSANNPASAFGSRL